MRKSLNTPYVKTHDETGVVSNPIVGVYASQGANRRDRRYKEPRFLNNKKHWPLTVSGNFKYIRQVQPIFDKVTGAITKKILHYLPR